MKVFIFLFFISVSFAQDDISSYKKSKNHLHIYNKISYDKNLNFNKTIFNKAQTLDLLNRKTKFSKSAPYSFTGVRPAFLFDITFNMTITVLNLEQAKKQFPLTLKKAKFCVLQQFRDYSHFLKQTDTVMCFLTDQSKSYVESVTEVVFNESIPNFVISKMIDDIDEKMKFTKLRLSQLAD